MMINNIMQDIAVQALPFIFAVTLHESAHAWFAHRCGDNTAKNAGRISLNPLVHIDPVGTVLIPLLLKLFSVPFLFGYAKPVPVNFNALRNPKRDMVIVAFAGPGTNIFLAFISGIFYRIILFFYPSIILYTAMGRPIPSGDIAIAILAPLGMMLQFSVIINVFLCFLNLLPLLPLDGGRILVGLLPEHYSEKLKSTEQYGIMILMFLFFLDPLNIMSGVFQPVVWFFARSILGFV